MTLTRRVLNEKRRLIYPLIAGLVFNAGLLLAVVYPLSQKVAGGEEQAQASASALAEARRDYDAARQTITGKVSADGELKKFYGAVLPPDLSAARRILFAIQELARSNNIKYGQARLDPERERDSHLGRLSLEVTLTGQYRDIRRLIYELETAKDFVILENVELSQGTDADSGLNVSVDLATYYRAGGNGS
jgi:hypothetical protein